MQRQHPSEFAGFEAVGGLVCLDLVNTLDWRTSARPVELLDGGDAVRVWARQALGSDPGPVEDAAARLRALRGAIIALVSSRGEAPGALAILNAELARAPDRSALVAGADGLSWEADGDVSAADRLVRTVGWSAADLLTDPRRLSLVRVCAMPECGWMFLDQSRAANRRWCSMRTCGNRAKARAHYRRRKGSSD